MSNNKKAVGCAPSMDKNKLTCYTKDALISIVKAYNQKYPKNKITVSNKTKEQLWTELKNNLKNECGNNEWCWLDQDFIKKAEANNMEWKHFRPKMPEHWKNNKYTWLATNDIDGVMKQYEKLYPDFMFLGAVPVDCHTLTFCRLYNLDIVKLYNNGIRRLGIVFNLDYHYQGGSHWVAVFIDLKDHKDITYYDSYGVKPPQLIEEFIYNILSECQTIKRLKDRVDYDYNKKRHQYGNSECGIYSQNYIIQRLKGKTLNEVTKKPIPDKIMNEMRKYLYRNTTDKKPSTNENPATKVKPSTNEKSTKKKPSTKVKSSTKKDNKKVLKKRTPKK